MKIKKATEILRKHNEWRRREEGGHGQMEKPAVVGTAIDIILDYIDGTNQCSSQSFEAYQVTWKSLMDLAE